MKMSSLRRIALVSAASATLAFAGTALAQQPRTLKIQSAVPPSSTTQDALKFFAERVEKLTGGQLKIESLPGGAVVPPFEILDGTHKKVIDGAWGISYWWYGKSVTATLFANTPAGIFGMDAVDFIGWVYEGGGLELWNEFYQKELEWKALVPISALKADQIEPVMVEMLKNLPESEPIFADDEFTDQSMRALAAEIVREKLLETTGEEIPYVTAVVTENWEDEREDFTRIHCAIFVERDSQKRIVIGHGAQRLKQIGIRARHDIEKMLGHRCHLELFVKVEADWRERMHLLDDMGIRS